VTQGKATARAASLLLLRLGTGSLLILWGSLRVMAPETGPGLADKYYHGLASMQAVQVAYGAAEIALGLLVCLGLFRRFAYPAQAVLLVLGLFAIGKYVIDPLGAWLLAPADAQILFFPSITVAAASLVLLAFREHDRWSLDSRLRPGG
jgi:putative oxidoreductase